MAKFEELDERYLYLVHGANDDSVESVFNYGICSNRGNRIGSVLTQLSKDDIKLKGLRALEKGFCDENYCKYCYVVKIPKFYYGWVGRDGAIEPPLPLFYEEDNKSMFTPHLVAGVYSRERDKVATNPNFNPKYNPNGMKYAKEQEELFEHTSLFNDWYRYASSRDGMTNDELKTFDEQMGTWRPVLQRYSRYIPELYVEYKAVLEKEKAK